MSHEPSSARSNSAAAADLADCAAAFDALGATCAAARVRADPRRRRVAGERRPPGRPRYGDVLSSREAEVAELAVAGMSDREIATTLHLSPRTVEQHVAQALRKTGAHPRRQLVQVLTAAQDRLRIRESRLRAGGVSRSCHDRPGRRRMAHAYGAATGLSHHEGGSAVLPAASLVRIRLRILSSCLMR
ncbi:helix-turn-helix transcriptional regulator [Streptomyces sp. NPDC058486]|uniref:helix-turn-helix domain-containing protein n=1 Tax=unclassified Streptomyces TaxID=2593676 RepID=UPI00364A3876